MPKVVLITGASSGIGKATATYLKNKGFIVYGTSRIPERYKESPFPILQMDVGNSETIKQAIRTLIEHEGQLDIVVNNAGAGIIGPIEELPNTAIKANFDTNLFGPIDVIKSVLPQMRKQQSGLIVNITSIGGYMGLPYRGIYSANKGALALLTEAFRMELRSSNIKMTCVAPGDFATNIATRRYYAPPTETSPYSMSYKKTLDTINAHVDRGSNPLVMGRAILKIIQTKNPKVHYKVGTFLERFSIVLKRLLPDTLYEELLSKYYHL